MMKPILCPKLIGRASYLEAIRQSLQQARAGQGQTVLLSGEAGIGKSRLVGRGQVVCRQPGVYHLAK